MTTAELRKILEDMDDDAIVVVIGTDGVLRMADRVEPETVWTAHLAPSGDPGVPMPGPAACIR